MNEGKTAVQSTRQREKAMTVAKSRFKIIYENILDDFGLLLSKERIFDNKHHFHQPKRERDGRRRKRWSKSAMQAAAKRVKNGSLVPWLYLSRHIWPLYNRG